MDVAVKPARSNGPAVPVESVMPEYLIANKGLSRYYEVLPSGTSEVEQHNSVYLNRAPAEAIFLVKAGAVILIRDSLSEKSGEVNEECAGVRGPGEVFGAFNGSRWTFEEAKALTDTTLQVCMIDDVPKELFVLELQRQLVHANESLSIALGVTSSEKIARMLLVLSCKRFYDPDEGLCFTHEVLTIISGTTRLSVSRKLADFRAKGLISTERGIQI